MTRTPYRRPGFTLIELLVAMGLAVVILAIGIAVSQSSAFESYKVVGGADRFSQWLLVAKNKALRDKAPRGVRLLADTNNQVRECVYIEQPEPWLPPVPTGTTAAPQLIFQYALSENRDPASPGGPPFMPPPPPLAANQRILWSGQANASDRNGPRGTGWRVFLSGISFGDFTAVVTPGDFLFVPSLGQSYQIVGIKDSVVAATTPIYITPAYTNMPSFQAAAPAYPTPATATIELLLAEYPDFGAGYSKFAPTPATDGVPLQTSPTYSTTQFGVVRQARPLLGEPTLQLPSGMIVDLNTNASLNPPPDVGGNRDILFKPSGEMVNAPEAVVCLLMRDAAIRPGAVNVTNQADLDAAGQMILVCIYARTGAIATQQVAPPPADPFSFARDGINSGL